MVTPETINLDTLTDEEAVAILKGMAASANEITADRIGMPKAKARERLFLGSIRIMRFPPSSSGQSLRGRDFRFPPSARRG